MASIRKTDSLNHYMEAYNKYISFPFITVHPGNYKAIDKLENKMEDKEEGEGESSISIALFYLISKLSYKYHS